MLSVFVIVFTLLWLVHLFMGDLDTPKIRVMRAPAPSHAGTRHSSELVQESRTAALARALRGRNHATGRLTFETPGPSNPHNDKGVCS
jgi:hypothetical protein